MAFTPERLEALAELARLEGVQERLTSLTTWREDQDKRARRARYVAAQSRLADELETGS